MSKDKGDSKLPPDVNPNYSPPPHRQEMPPTKKLATRFHSDMPPAFAAAGKIIQLLTALSLSDAQEALAVVNQLFKSRKEIADKPPHLPEE